MKYIPLKERIEENIDMYISCLKNSLEEQKKEVALTFYYMACGSLEDLEILNYISYEQKEARKEEIWKLIYPKPIL